MSDGKIDVEVVTDEDRKAILVEHRYGEGDEHKVLALVDEREHTRMMNVKATRVLSQFWAQGYLPLGTAAVETAFAPPPPRRGRA